MGVTNRFAGWLMRMVCFIAFKLPNGLHSLTNSHRHRRRCRAPHSTSLTRMRVCEFVQLHLEHTHSERGGHFGALLWRK